MSEGKTWPFDREAWAALHAECPRNIPLAFKATCADKDVCQRSFAAGASHEREECAKVASEREAEQASKAGRWMQSPWPHETPAEEGSRHATAAFMARDIKNAIRARGKA